MWISKIYFYLTVENNSKKIWQSVLTELEIQVSKPVYKTFLSQTKLLSVKDQTATIGCSQPMFINLIENRYYDLIKKTLDLHTKKDTKLVFIADQSKEKNSIEGPLFTTALPTQHKTKTVVDVGLNQDYTFDNFAVSSSNQMAHAAATAVAKSPGSSYNPLFLYGGVGVGKTHLMQAIGHYVLERNPKVKFIYCTGEEFTNEIIEAIRNKTTSNFKRKYRQVKMLLIDDVQFIAGKYSIQEEFFHTFNAISQAKGQIVLTSDKPPDEINKLEARLKSRFEGGLTIDIGQPDFELLTAILLIKTKQRKVNLPIDLAKMIAANIENPRKLEGVLLRIQTEAELRNIPIDYELVKKILGKNIQKHSLQNNIKPKEVIVEVASYFQLKLSQLKGNKRDKRLSLPRQILYYLLRVEMSLPLTEIGFLLGGRDHTTILYGVRKISRLISINEKVREDVVGIKNKVFG